MPRLTSLQYRNSLQDIFAGSLPSTALEPDTNPYLFYSIGASTTTLSEQGTQQYAEAAGKITDLLFQDATRRAALLGCTPTRSDDKCVRDFITRIGRKLFRRPLAESDITRWVGVSTATADGDVFRGVKLALYGMLQSPRFIYRIELGEPDPEDHGTPQRRRYDAYEMASRLSFLFWNTTPDDELLDAAERGELVDAESLRRHALRLIESQRARTAVQNFFGQYFNLGVLAQAERDAVHHPMFTRSLAAAMRSELELLADDFVFRSESDVRKMFSTRRTFVNSELAALYQINAPGATPIAFVPVELPADGPRAGILTLGAFLTMNAHPTETSPTLRGKYILERVLCRLVPPPPGNVNLNLDDMMGQPRTLRERLEEHRKNPACASCHSMMDPPGFLFEGFDSIGKARPMNDALAAQTRSEVEGQTYNDGRELGQKLADDPYVAQCMLKQLYRHANGRLDDAGDERPLQTLGQQFEKSGYRFRELMIALVQSEGFRTAAPAEEVTP